LVTKEREGFMEDSRLNTIQKIKKLLAMAAGKANLNEALAAAEVAQRLILLHAVEDFELASVGGTQRNLEPIVDFVETHGETFSPWRNPPDWIKALFFAVAKHNGCGLYTLLVESGCEEKPEPQLAFSIVGQQSSIDFVAWFATWMTQQACSLYLASNTTPEKANDFFLGIVKKLDERLEAASLKAPIEGLNEEKRKNALSCLNSIEKQVQDAMNAAAPNSNGQAKPDDNMMFGRGYMAANSLQITQQKTLQSTTLKSLTEG
jgi:hypothetical protein